MQLANVQYYLSMSGLFLAHFGRLSMAASNLPRTYHISYVMHVQFTITRQKIYD